MIKNYLRIAWRNLTKHSFYSLVNILGLFSGITFILLLGAYVWQELCINKKLKNSGRQCILTTVSTEPGIGYELATFGPMAKRLKEDYPTLVANYYRWDGVTSVVSKGDKHFREGLQIGDSTLLKMYGFRLLHGDINTALLEPFSVIITPDKAIKYFGRTDVIGETITIQNFSGGTHDFTITGIIHELPENSVSHLARDYPNAFFIPLNTLSFFGRQDINSWGNMFIASYVELKEGVTVKDLEKPIRQLVQQHADASLKKIITVKPVLLADYYLQKDKGLVQRMLYTLAFAGIFILLMAIANFINITISRSSLRMREIGLRKVLGGIKKQLIFQFLTESCILVLIATLLAVGGYVLFRPVFARVVGKEIPAISSFPLYFIFIPLAITAVVGLLAGLYPAFILSSLKSVDSLKGKLKNVKESVGLRKALTGFQFSLAIIVLIAAVIVTQQINHFFSRRLGYNKEYVVSAQVPRDWTTAGVEKMLTVRNQFATLSQVSDISLSFEIPDGNNGGQVPIYKFGSDSTSASFVQLLQTDENYLKTYQIPMKAGSFFENNGQDSGRVIINEKTAALLGYPDAYKVIGLQLRIPGDPTLFTVKGVVKDFAFGSMQQTVSPVLFFNVRFSPVYRYFSFKIKPGDMRNSLTAIENKWATLLPGTSFEYKFMDDTLKNLYKTEIQLKNASYTAALLALVMVLLGVLGFITLSIQKRTKEIGIRKVLGASIGSITLLFMKEVLTVIFFAALIGCPLAWLIMQGWLNGYAYRVSMTAGPFIISVTGLACITALLIILQTAKTSLENPIKSLRSE